MSKTGRLLLRWIQLWEKARLAFQISILVAVWSFYLSWQKALRSAKHSEHVSKTPHSLLVPLTVYGQDFCCSQWSSIVFTWPNYQLKASLLIHLWLQILSRILCVFLVFWARLFKNSKQKVLQKQFNYCPIIGRFEKHVLCLKRTRSLSKASEMVFKQCFRFD